MINIPEVQYEILLKRKTYNFSRRLNKSFNLDYAEKYFKHPIYKADGYKVYRHKVEKKLLISYRYRILLYTDIGADETVEDEYFMQGDRYET